MGVTVPVHTAVHGVVRVVDGPVGWWPSWSAVGVRGWGWPWLALWSGVVVGVTVPVHTAVHGVVRVVDGPVGWRGLVVWVVVGCS